MTLSQAYIPIPLFSTGKACTKCGVEKPPDEFRRDRSKSDGRSPACKACLNTQQNARYRELPERHAQYRETAKARYAGRVAPAQKVCPGCGLSKPSSAFSPSTSSSDRLRSRCKECEAATARAYNQQHCAERTAYRRAWRESNLEHARETARQYYASHAEQEKEWARTSYMRHREERLAQQRVYRVENAEQKRQRDRKYYEAHKDELAAYSREYYRRHKEEAKAQARAWVKKNPDRRWANQRRYRQKNLHSYAAYARRRAARRRAAEGHHTAADIARLYNDQQGLCYYCACLLTGKYHVDHKQPVTKGGSEWPSNLCCACERCNTRKQAMTESQFKALLEQERC